jgi:hypothetical protein
MSLCVCETLPPLILTPGAMSALMKCSGTRWWMACVGVDALEVAVQDQRLPRVPLRVTQDDAFGNAVDIQRQDGRVERFLAQVEQDLVVIEVDQLRTSRATVNDGRDPFLRRRRRLAPDPCKMRLRAST